MTLTITIDPTWLAHPEPLGRILDQIRAVEHPAPWTPPATRAPGQDDDDLAVFLDGIDEPAAAPAVASRPSERIRPPAHATAPPATGKALYRWACDRKALPEVNRIGKAHGFPRMVSDWTPSDVAVAYNELTKPKPAVNGRAH
jgi:hypothetical protein